MKKLLIAFSCLVNPCLYSGIYESHSGYILAHQELVYDDFLLNLSCPDWQPRQYYYGITSSSVGYFYVNNWNGDVAVYGSNRYVLNDDAEAFYQSLQPLEANLLPYATPNAGSCTASRVLSKEAAAICGLPAIKVVFELNFQDREDEIVASYIFTKPKSGLFSKGLLGYTYSVSCSKSKYLTQKLLIQDIVSRLEVR